MPGFLVRLQRGFAIVAVVAVILWVVKRHEANSQQRIFLITAFSGAIVGIIIAGVIQAMRDR